MTRKEALFAVIGGVVGAVLVMAAGSFAPLGAQNDRREAEFGKITCTELEVVHAHRPRNPGVRIIVDEHGGAVGVFGRDTNNSALMDVHEHGGRFGVFGRGSSKSRASMGVNEYGNGAVSTWDKNGYRLATLE